MGIADSMKKAAFSTAFSYIGKNPEENAPKLMAWVDKLAGEGPDSFPAQRAAIRNVINDKDNNMHQLVMDIMKDTDPDVLKATFMNFFLNANIIGWPKQEENRKKYNCNIPWAILLDPTSACNLHCTGCWAAEYGNKLNLSFDEIDSIITQGKEMGVYFYIYTGGEPLVRKEDLIKICRKHNDCVFLSFTNGTLIDEAFADERFITPVHKGENFCSSGHLYLLRINGADHEKRCEIIRKMGEKGVACNVHYKPLPLLSAYKKRGFDIADYPESYKMYENEVSLPLHTLLTDEQVEYIISSLKEIVK